MGGLGWSAKPGRALAACATLAALLLMAAGPAGAASENDEIKLIGSYGFPYLPTYVVIEKKLIEKHAEALGISPKVNFTFASGGGAITDALLSGTADVSSVAPPILIYLWDKARGSKAVRGVQSLLDAPPMLFTNDPKIHSIKDFTSGDRIAMTTAKVSSFAIMLQMAAVQQFGWDQRFKFDEITVAMSAPDSTAAILSGGSEVRSATELVPYNVELLESPNVRMILNGKDVFGGSAALTVLAATEKFHSERPKAYQAVKDAFREAIELINADKDEAARISIKYEPNRNGAEWIKKILSDKSLVEYTVDPHGFGKLSGFIHQLGTIKNKPDSWKDLFFDGGARLDGN